jgi:ribosomal protein S18 acetylase RimI-like enzyme
MHDGGGSITIRRAERSEATALAHLHEGHALFRRYAIETHALADSLAQALDAGDGVMTALRAGDPIGFAWWAPRGAFSRSPYLRLLVVAAQAAGTGAGTALMDAVERDAFAQAADLFLLVTRDNAGARRFYERRGFEAVGELHGYAAPGVDEVVMRKRRPTSAPPPVTTPPA